MGNNIIFNPKKKIESSLNIYADNPEDLLHKSLTSNPIGLFEDNSSGFNEANGPTNPANPNNPEGGIDPAIKAKTEEFSLDINKFNQNKNLDDFNNLPISNVRQLLKNDPAKLKLYDDTVTKLMKFFDGNVKLTDGKFELKPDDDPANLIKTLDEGAKDVPLGVIAAMSIDLAKVLFNNPQRLNTLLATKQTLYLAPNGNLDEQGGRAVGLFLPEAQTGTNRNAVIVDESAVLSDFITSPSIKGDGINQGGVFRHEQQHAIDDAGGQPGKLDGVPSDWSKEKVAEFETLKNEVVA